mmetsp:Transcript_69176/g.156351  ORF Transcript_69176/g.156351 Transcript_69176/m.156351 type:complete len:215 (+) Transcript_69176:562-1206(+)
MLSLGRECTRSLRRACSHTSGGVRTRPFKRAWPRAPRHTSGGVLSSRKDRALRLLGPRDRDRGDGSRDGDESNSIDESARWKGAALSYALGGVDRGESAGCSLDAVASFCCLDVSHLARLKNSLRESRPSPSESTISMKARFSKGVSSTPMALSPVARAPTLISPRFSTSKLRKIISMDLLQTVGSTWDSARILAHALLHAREASSEDLISAAT